MSVVANAAIPTGPWLVADAGYERDASSADTTETGTEVESTRGFALQDDDEGDKFVVKVPRRFLSAPSQLANKA